MAPTDRRFNPGDDVLVDGMTPGVVVTHTAGFVMVRPDGDTDSWKYREGRVRPARPVEQPDDWGPSPDQEAAWDAREDDIRGSAL